MKRLIIQILAIAVAIVLAYLIWDTIQTPIDFEKEKNAKYDAVIENLKVIRDS